MGIKQRGYKRKPRNTADRKRKSVIFIATEGNNKTETNYFTCLMRDNDQKYTFAPGNYTDPKNMVYELITELEKKDFSPEYGDKAYCLIDADCNRSKDKQIAEAEAIALENGIELIVSAPCFEIWFMCHFVFSTKSYCSNTELIADIQAYLPGYSKSDAKIYEKTKDRILTAIKNAKKLETDRIKSGYKQHTTDFNPSTDVYKIVEGLIKK